MRRLRSCQMGRQGVGWVRCDVGPWASARRVAAAGRVLQVECWVGGVFARWRAAGVCVNGERRGGLCVQQSVAARGVGLQRGRFGAVCHVWARLKRAHLGGAERGTGIGVGKARD